MSKEDPHPEGPPDSAAPKPRGEWVHLMLRRLTKTRVRTRAEGRISSGRASATETALQLQDKALEYLHLASDELKQGGLHAPRGIDDLEAWLACRSMEISLIKKLARAVARAVAANDSRAAAKAGFALGEASGLGFWSVFLEDDAERGKKAARAAVDGAAKGNLAQRQRAERNQAEWITQSKKLDPRLSLMAKARLVARASGAKLETVRKALAKESR